MKVRWIPKPVIVSTEYDALYFGEPRYIKAKLKEITGQSFMVSMQNDDDGNPRSGYPIRDYVLVDARIQLFKDDVLLVRTDIYSDGSKRYGLFKNTRDEFKQRYEITEEDDNENLVVAKRTELIERLKEEGRQAEIPLELNKLMHALEADGTIEKQVLVNLVEKKRLKQQLIKYAKDHEMPRRTVYQIKIDGKYIRKGTYRGYKRVWPNRGAAWQALQMIVGNGDYKEKVNPVIQSYIDEGFIEIVEV